MTEKMQHEGGDRFGKALWKNAELNGSQALQ